MECMVTVIDPMNGYRLNLRGLGFPVVGLMDTGKLPPDPDHEGVDQRGAMMNLRVWTCYKRDVDTLVKHLSEYWVNQEIRVYDLVSIATRLPGELKSKEVSKDGVLPV